MLERLCKIGVYCQNGLKEKRGQSSVSTIDKYRRWRTYPPSPSSLHVELSSFTIIGNGRKNELPSFKPRKCNPQPPFTLFFFVFFCIFSTFAAGAVQAQTPEGNLSRTHLFPPSLPWCSLRRKVDQTLTFVKQRHSSELTCGIYCSLQHATDSS